MWTNRCRIPSHRFLRGVGWCWTFCGPRSARFPVHALVEYDVTEARRRMAEAPEHVSWTGFVVASLGQAVAMHPEINARKAGRRIVQFGRVDIAATVERQGAPGAAPTPVTIRSADLLPPARITAALSEAKRSRPAAGRTRGKPLPSRPARAAAPRGPSRGRRDAPGRGVIRTVYRCDLTGDVRRRRWVGRAAGPAHPGGHRRGRRGSPGRPRRAGGHSCPTSR